MKKALLLILHFVLFGFAPTLNAQQITLSGTVTDSSTGESLVGVTVKLDDSFRGTSTDVDGVFSLELSKEELQDGSLIFSFIGYKSYRLPLQPDIESPLKIQLEPDFVRGEDIVVTGQGMNMERRRISTNVVSIDQRDLETSSSNRIDELLQSKIPNAQFRMTNGQPGSSSIIRSRGVVSAFNNSTPVIYVDGVRMDNLNTKSELGGGSTSGAATSALSDIPVGNIERIEFINGGAATTLYGSDAANGVIQIFTKKGGTGAPQLSFSTQIGATTPTNDFLQFDRTADLLFQTGLHQNYNVQFSGGDPSFGYSFSGSFTDDEGFRISNKNQNNKVNLSTGFSSQLSDKVSYKSSFGYTRNDFNRVRNGNAGGYTGLWYTESGSSLFTGPGFNPNLNELSDEDFSRMVEFVRLAEGLQENKTKVNRFHTSQIFEYTPSSSWLLKATAGVDYRVQDEEIVTTNEFLNLVDNLSVENSRFDRGRINKFDRSFLGLTAEITVQNKTDIKDFSFITTAGGQFFRDEDEQVAISGIDIRDGALSVSQAATTESDEFLSEVVNYGLYFQENAGYKNRYFLEFGIRGDGNSAFGDNVGIQFYPKVGASYLVSAEPFFLDTFGNTTFSYLKIKASFGVAGNFPRPFANERTIDFDGFLGGQAATFGQQGNDDLKPEKTFSYEAGMDLGFVKDRILFNVNYYRTETEDALFFVPLAPSVGEGTQLSNVGEIVNKGWEISTTIVPVLNRNWNVRFKAAFNTLDNEVVDAGGAGAFNINGFSSRTIQTVVEEGFPIGFLRGNKATFENGVMVSTEPLAFLGSTIPEYFGSFSLDAEYKNIRFFTNADFELGAYAHSFERQFRFLWGASSNNEGIPDAEVEQNGTSNWLNLTDQFVEKTDFLKIRTFGLNYSIGQQALGNLANRITLGFTVVNPLNFNSASFDPEATQSGADQGQNTATTGGIAYAAESAPRQFLGTLKINF
jgi:TonB-dependent starch-binding outer membrane protein SusC